MKVGRTMAAAGTVTASGSNTVFVNGVAGGSTLDRGPETGTLVVDGTGGGTSTPPRPRGTTGGTGI